MLIVGEATKRHMRWLLKNGNSNFCFDNWIGEGSLASQGFLLQDGLVCDYMLNGDWNASLLRQHLPPKLTAAILQLSPPSNDQLDECIGAFPSREYLTSPQLSTWYVNQEIHLSCLGKYGTPPSLKKFTSLWSAYS